MKNILLFVILIMFLAVPCTFADSWDDFADIDRAWDGQKSITNQEFEDAIETLEGNQKSKEEKQRNKQIKKISRGGTSLHSDLAPLNNIPAQQNPDQSQNGFLLNIPVSMLIDNLPLEKGFYNVYANKDENNDIYFSFYQSQFFKGKVKANETNNDYGFETIDFIELVPYDDNFIKIIFGSLDFNAYAYVPYE